MDEDKTRIVGMIFRTWGVLEMVVGYFYEDESGMIRAPVLAITAGDRFEPVGPAGREAASSLVKLLDLPPASLSSC